MFSRKQISYVMLTILGGIVASFIDILLLSLWVDLGWRSPISNWMMAHGMGIFAGYFGLLYIQIPTYTTSIIGGAIIGYVACERWWQLSLVFSGTIFACPYLSMAIGGFIPSISSISFWLAVYVILLNAAVIFLSLASAWISSKPQRLRNLRRELRFCLKCGYDLTGNQSGICSECGRPVKQYRAL